MDNFFWEMFNTREIAICIWLIPLSIWLLNKKSFKQSIGQLVKKLFQPLIIIPYVGAIIYTLFGVYILWLCKLWTIGQLKDTIIWSFAVISIILDINKFRDSKTYFRETVKGNFKMSAIVGFITGIYTFNLWIEIGILPLCVLSGLMLAVSEKRQKSSRFLKSVLIVLVIANIGYTIFKIIADRNQFVSVNTLSDFILSPFLGIWFLPFLYLLSLYSSYESSFISIQATIEDKKLLSFAKWNAFMFFSTDKEGLNRWLEQIIAFSPKTKDDVLRSIKAIKQIQKVEMNPPLVSYKFGWSPYTAKNFLITKGIRTGYYKKVYEDDWIAISDYIKLDNSDFLPNMFSFYVEGTEKVVSKLILVLDINNLAKSVDATQCFIDFAETLNVAANGNQLPDKLISAIQQRTNFRVNCELVKLVVELNKSTSGRYSIIFQIEHTYKM